MGKRPWDHGLRRWLRENEFNVSVKGLQVSRFNNQHLPALYLSKCKMDNIQIPIKQGSLEEIDDEGGDESMDMSSSQPSHIIYEKEAAIEIDYALLEEGLTELDDNDDVRKVEKTLELKNLNSHLI